MSEFYVYILFRPWDGSPCYVGKGKDNRWMTNASGGQYNRHLAFILKKALRLGLDVPRVKVRENLSEAQAFQCEAAFIGAIGRRYHGPLVNLTAGGDGGRDPSPETRAKQSAAAIERMKSPQARARISSIHKGRKNSPETCAKMSASHLGLTLSLEHRSAIRRGWIKRDRNFPLEVRMKMSRSQKKRDHRASYSTAHKEAIRAGVAAFWQRRRVAGLPLKHPRKGG